MHHTRTQKICALTGYFAIALFGLAFWPFSRFIPVPSPSLMPDQVAAIYQQHTNGIRFGMLLMMISSGLVIPFVAVISIQIKRIEGASPILAYTQLCAGSINALFFIIPALLFTATAFRPDRSPELTSVLNDLAWLFAIMPVFAALVQDVAIGCAILGDTRAAPVFPRWLGFFNIWVGIGLTPGALITFFKSGPFAWSGLFPFYIAGCLFGTWFIVMTVMLMKAINQQALGSD